MMATAAVRQTSTATATAAAAGPAKTRRSTPQPDALRVGWAVRNRAGQVVVIYEGATARAVAEEWAADREYTVEAVTL